MLSMKELPKAFVDRMSSILGQEEYSCFNKAINGDPIVSVRVNPYKIPQGWAMQDNLRHVLWCDDGFYFDERPIFTLDPLLHGGAYYVQEASSMFLYYILGKIMSPHEPIRVLDLCAAPGGKSTLVASELPHGSLLVANEVIKSRASILKENVIKWGTGNVVVTNSDPSAFSEMEGAFDIIIVDAPCSGEGMFRKDQRAIEEWSENNLRICEERQQRILRDIWPALKPGGYLIYSTCTYNDGENGDMLKFMQQEFGAYPVEIRHRFSEIVPSKVNFGYHFMPHKVLGEGFFVGVVRKDESEECSDRWMRDKKDKRGAAVKSVKLPKQVASLIKNVQEYATYENEEGVGIVPKCQERFIAQLEQRARVIYKGCEVAQLLGDKYKLLPPLALFAGLDKDAVTVYEADRMAALKFLKREDIDVAAPNGAWVLVSYLGVGLGWGKKTGNRLNNNYPKGWMIRMDIN